MPLNALARASVVTAVSIATLLAGLPGRAYADDVPVQRAYLTTRVNDAGGKDVLVVTRGDEILVHADELRELGLKIPTAAIVLDRGEQFISLRALGSGVEAHIDPVALTLTIKLPAEMFDAQSIAVNAQQRNVTVAPASHGSFLNYAVRTETGALPAFTGNTGTRIGAGVLESTIARPLQTAGYALRQNSYTIDDFAKAQRMVLGTSSINADDFAGLGGSAYIDGFSIRRDRTLNPNLLRQSSSAVSGVAASPSTVEIYVNGTLVRRDTIGPGAFQITDIPLQTGINHTTVVVRDAFGQTQTIQRPDYLSADLLPAGEREIDLGAGRSKGDYEQAVAAGRYALGITNHLTLGMRGSLAAAGGNAGISAAFATPVGEFSAATAISDVRSGSAGTMTVIDAANTTGLSTGLVTQMKSLGNATALSFSRTTRRGYAGLSYIHRSPTYGSLSLDPATDRALLEMRGYASTTFGSGPSLATLTLDVSNALARDSGWSRSVDVSLRHGLGRSGWFGVSVGQANVAGTRGATFSIQIMRTLFGANQLALSTSNQGGSASQTIGVMSPGSSELGTSYTAQFTNGPDPSGTFSWERRAKLGTLQVDASQSGQAAAQYSATLSGAIAYAGGSWYLSREITSGFGVVDVNGIPGVPIRVNGQAIGTTDAHGRIFVPNLAPSMVNDVTLDSEHLPNDVEVDSVSAQVTPLYRSPALVSFAARRIRAYVGVLRLDGGSTATLAYGVASVRTPKGEIASDVGSDGRFYFDQLTPGTYALRVQYRGGACVVKRFVLPETTSVMTNLGTLLCEREGK